MVIGNEKSPGGILIRKIERKNAGENEVIDGPLKVLLELMNQSVDVFDSQGPLLQLVAAENPIQGKPGRKPRVGIKNDTKQGYNFYIK